jgi:dienelactone hydrolase
MRRHWLITLLLIVGLFANATPVRAEVISFDPGQGFVTTLDEAEAMKIRTLQSTVETAVLSPVSPDDTTVLISFFEPGNPQVAGLSFLNVQDGTRTPVQIQGVPPIPFSNIVWRDARTATYVGLSLGAESGPVRVTLDRVSGALNATALTLPGFPFPAGGLAPDGRSLLVVLGAPGTTPGSSAGVLHSPFDIEIRRYIDPATTPGLAADRTTMQVSSNPTRLAVFDLFTGNLTPLLELPEGTFPGGAAWSPDSRRLAVMRTTLVETLTETLLHAVIIQNTFGNLPPAENPFLQNNVIDIFNLASGDFRPGAIQAAAASSDTFSRVAWSSDSQVLLAQMQRPAQLQGRTYPVYLLRPQSSYLRFYSADGQLLNSFDRPEIAAPLSSVPRFVSPDEVLINAVEGLTAKLFYYNRVSGEFRQLPLPDGSALGLRNNFVATNQTRQVIFPFSSFQQPPELFRINWDGTAFNQLTFFNLEAQQVNQVRVDRMRFTLQNGAQRVGYLIQPAGAPFPPQNAPVIIWQAGGPGGAMVNMWGNRVEQPFNLLPNFGFALLVVPLPGREGFGPAFHNALYDGDNFGQIDIDEMAAIVEQMIQRGETSRGQVGITGCSYGGYFTVQSLVRHPNTYAAANTQCTLLDLYNEWQFGLTALTSFMMGEPPTEIAAKYSQDSPFYNAPQITTPLLIFHGSEDYLPIQIVSNFYDQVASQFLPVQYFRFEGEPHGLITPTSQFVAAQAQINWFRTYLD